MKYIGIKDISQFSGRTLFDVFTYYQCDKKRWKDVIYVGRKQKEDYQVMIQFIDEHELRHWKIDSNKLRRV